MDTWDEVVLAKHTMAGLAATVLRTSQQIPGNGANGDLKDQELQSLVAFTKTSLLS